MSTAAAASAPRDTPEVSTRAGFEPYRVVECQASRDEVLLRCNRQNFAGYGPDPGRDPFRVQAYPLRAYVDLLESLASMEHVEVVTLGELCRRPDGGDRVRLAIRHDVDSDVVAALRMADLEHRAGLPTSYYMLHTAAYHGVFDGGVLHRNECIAHVYREIETLGHEVGLHTDGLTVYQEYGVDGAEAITQEIAWMRERGLDVTGTVAHGSKSAFGAENYEIFAGRRKGRPRDLETAGEPELLEHRGSRAWLRVLDEDALGLDYEGNDIFRQKLVRVEYGATRTVDGWRWNAHRRRREAAGPPFGPEFCLQDEMLRDIGRLEPGCCVVLTVHPCYYGLRSEPDCDPPLRFGRAEGEVSNALGWRTHRPKRVHGWCGEPPAGRPWQTIARANALGMLDVPYVLAPRRRAAGLRILLVDGGNLDGRGAAIPSHAHRLLERMVLDDAGRDTARLKLAHEGMGIARLWPWLIAGLRRFRPHVVVLGVTSQELRRSAPSVWSVETGFSRHHPPGDFLDWRDGTLVETRRSRRWAIRRRRPRAIATWPGTRDPVEQVMGIDDRLRLGDADARKFLASCYGHAGAKAWEHGARCFVMITESGEEAGWSRTRAGGSWVDPRQEVFRQHVADLAGQCGEHVIDPVIDPYLDFVDECGTHHADGRWTPEAHRLAARALYDGLHEAVSG